MVGSLERCYICWEMETEEGEQCARACNFCRRSNVHISCLVEYHNVNLENTANRFGECKCPTCRRQLGAEFSLKFFTQQLEILEQRRKQDYEKLVITLANLGMAYRILGDAEKSQELVERALVIAERKTGPDSRVVAMILTNLGGVYGSLGDDKKSQEILERALVINEREYGPDHRKVAMTLTNLGITYANLGDAKKSREILERALGINERVYGPDHHENARILKTLGFVYGDLGNVGKERELLERADMINEREYGPNHCDAESRNPGQKRKADVKESEVPPRKIQKRSLGRFYRTQIPDESVEGIVNKFELDITVFMQNNVRKWPNLKQNSKLPLGTEVDISRDIRIPVIKNISEKPRKKSKIVVQWEDSSLNETTEDEEVIKASLAFRLHEAMQKEKEMKNILQEQELQMQLEKEQLTKKMETQKKVMQEKMAAILQEKELQIEIQQKQLTEKTMLLESKNLQFALLEEKIGDFQRQRIVNF